MGRWSRRSLLLALAALPARALAHAGHPASAWLRSAQWDREALRLVVLVFNEGDSAVTLHGLGCAAARAVVFERERRLLGVPVSRPAGDVRLGRNELVRLGDGPFRLALTGLDPDAAEVVLTLDFGPDGVVPVAVPVPAR